MHLYWLFLAPILLAIALFLSAVLIKEKKRVGLVFLGILNDFDLYFVFNPINIFRIDFDRAETIVPLGCYLTHLKKSHFKKPKNYIIR